MIEKVYKTMSRAGIWNLVIGIIILVYGVTTGILMIISGARLLHAKKNLMF